jgi:hypothetical protein
MPKAIETRFKPANLVLTELPQPRFCAEARSVTVIGLDEAGFDATWAVTNFDPGQGIAALRRPTKLHRGYKTHLISARVEADYARQDAPGVSSSELIGFLRCRISESG